MSKSYLFGIGHIHDSEMTKFAEENNVTIDQLIIDMVNEGWTQGLDNNYQYEYWENDIIS